MRWNAALAADMLFRESAVQMQRRMADIRSAGSRLPAAVSVRCAAYHMPDRGACSGQGLRRFLIIAGFLPTGRGKPPTIARRRSAGLRAGRPVGWHTGVFLEVRYIIRMLAGVGRRPVPVRRRAIAAVRWRNAE